MLRVPRVLGTDELAHPGSRDILLERHLVGLHLAEHLNVSRGDEIASLGGRSRKSATTRAISGSTPRKAATARGTIWMSPSALQSARSNAARAEARLC